MKLIKENIPFTMVANEILYNKNLSFRSKGLYAYLFSKPDTWDFSSSRMILETTDGREAIMTMLRELEDAGYLSRKRLSTGKMEYNLIFSRKSLSRENPLGVEKPKSEKASVGISLCGESRPISNTEEKVISKEESNTSEQSSRNPGIPLLIKSFESINPNAKRFYENITQRKACAFLIETYGFEKVSAVITKLLPKTNGMKFFPSIITPSQLQDKWAALEINTKRYQADKLSNKKKIWM